MAIVVEPIELRENNLYAAGRILLFENDETFLERDIVETEGDLDDSYYVIKKEDRLDYIAWRFYNELVEDSSKYWWVIADANEIEIENPLDLADLVGVEILIPNILNTRLEV